MKRTAFLIAALTGMLLAHHAQAQQSGPGGYVGIGVGSVWSDGGTFFSNTINEDTVVSGKVFVGFMTDANWGVEIGLHHLGRFDVFLLGTKTDQFWTTAASVAGVYTTPLGAGYSFNGRLGLAFTYTEYDCLQSCGGARVDTNKLGTSGMWGLGVGARLAQNLQARVDFEHFGSVHHAVGNTGYKDSYDVFSVNLVLMY